MNTITLDHTLPDVFIHSQGIQSEVWQQHIMLERGQLYLLEANSGTGKSSLCSYIIGYRKDYQGHILFDGADIRHHGVSDWTMIRQHQLSHLFQELRLFPELSAMENIQIKNNITGFKSEKQISAWFDALGIADKMDSPVRFLSFGQQQRVAMIRALVQPFDFILVDEPISHLDDGNSRIMGDIMLQEAKAQGAGVIVTSIGKHMDLLYDKTFLL